jgi:PAS domain S-box-containing protein
MDWTGSPLGPAETWPLQLRHTIDLILPAGAQIVVFWGPDYLSFYNDAYAPTIGDKHPKALGRPAIENWAELWDDLEPLLNAVRSTGETLVAKDRPFYIERRGYGENVYFDISYSPLRDDLGAVEGVLCIVNETTERVVAEAALRQAEADAARLAAIVQSSEDAIVSKDLSGTITSWNAGAQRLFGYTAGEAIGSSITLLIPQDRLEEENEILAKIRLGIRTEHFETKRRRKDGSLFDISLTVSPVKDKTGRIIGASKIGRDITERRQADETQLLLVGELNHRVKNTLATVQAIAQQTLKRTQTPADFVRSFSGRIQSLARVHNLLSATTWQSAGLRELIRDQLLNGAVDKTRIAIAGPELTLGPQTALHMAMILHEMGTNAVKYGALSGADGTISIRWSADNGSLTLCWQEHGGPAVATTTKRGFGTALIEQSAKSEGGTARMRSGKTGVEWEIRLPFADRSSPGNLDRPGDTVAQQSGPRDQLETRGAPGNLAGKRFLVIEDEPLVAMDLSDMLETVGVEVVATAGSIAEALKLIDGTSLDAALLDANLHGNPVDDIAVALTHKNVPFAFISGYGRESLPRGFQNVRLLSKPFNSSDFFDTVAKVIDQRPESTPLPEA